MQVFENVIMKSYEFNQIFAGVPIIFGATIAAQDLTNIASRFHTAEQAHTSHHSSLVQ